MNRGRSFSDSSESEPYVDSGSEYSLSNSEASSSSSTSSADVDNEIVDFETTDNFTITNGYALKEISKKSAHKVWDHFGTLFKANQLVSKTQDRIFCRKCFEKNTIKRLVIA